MIAVAVARPHVYASTRQSLHGAEAHMRLFAPMLAQVLWNQPDKRTSGAAVRLLRRQLDLYDVSFRHFIFRLSGKYYSLRLSPVLGVALFRDSTA